MKVYRYLFYSILLLLTWPNHGAGQNQKLDSLSKIVAITEGEAKANALLHLTQTRVRMGIMDSMDLLSSEVIAIGREVGSNRLISRGFGGLLNHDFIFTEERIPELVDSTLKYLRLAQDYKRQVEVLNVYGYWLCDEFRCEEGLEQLGRSDSLAQTLDLRTERKAKIKLTYLLSLEACFEYGLIPDQLPSAITVADQIEKKDVLFSIYAVALRAYLKLNQLDSARNYLHLSKNILPNTEKREKLASYYGKAAEVALSAGEYERAYQLAAKSLQEYQDKAITVPYMVAPKNLNAGIAAYSLGQYALSLTHLKAARPYFEGAGRPLELAEFYAHYGNTQAALGNTKLAVEYQRKSRAVNDSLLTVRHQARIDHLMAEYETERIKRRLVQSEVSRLTAERAAARYRSVGLLLLLACLLGGAIWWYLNNRRRRRQLEYKKQQAELRYALLRAQMNPHFIFNSLNSIQSFFSNQRFNTGNDYLSIFSQLVRRILEQTAQTAIPLSEELETLELYLSLEKLRLGKLLSYDIHLIGDVAPDITYVPPLVFQPFVENAIWHGIAPRNAPGKIDIFIRYEEEQHYLHGRIEDDGIGLQAPPKIESHRSQGVRITRERLGPGGNVNISNRFGPDRQVEGVRTELIIPLHN